jgi:hypothetical protein
MNGEGQVELLAGFEGGAQPYGYARCLLSGLQQHSGTIARA